MPAIHVEEKAHQKSCLHAHITHKVYMARMAIEEMKYRNIPNFGTVIYRPNVIKIAINGDRSNGGSFFSLFHMACSSVIASRYDSSIRCPIR